jgi:hypothetical protein
VHLSERGFYLADGVTTGRFADWKVVLVQRGRA